MCRFDFWFFFYFANILVQQGLSISFPCKGTITNADSSVLGRKKHKDLVLLFYGPGVTGAFGVGERTETAVMPHNVTFQVVASQKLLQALPGHGGLRSQRTSELSFITSLLFACKLQSAAPLPAPWQR